MSDSLETVGRVAAELSIDKKQVAACLELLGEGATVPFIARYRKERTGGLDEVQIRAIGERHQYLVELDKRRETILSSIEEQGKLTAELREQILGCETKVCLEDLYLPYRPKRRTRATMARERGLEPLARRIREQPGEGDPLGEAVRFVDPERDVPDAEAALAGARDIVAEEVAEDAGVRALVRRVFAEQGMLRAEVVPSKKEERTKFEQYYGFRERLAEIPSHRFLAIARGEKEEVLRSRVEVDVEALLERIGELAGLCESSPFGAQLGEAVTDGYRRLIAPRVEKDVRAAVKERSDRSAIDVFAENLRNLLLAPPFGGRPVVGIDPGLRTGCKCVAVDATGKFLANTTFHLPDAGGRDRAAGSLRAFVEQHAPAAVAVGNGTGGRDTEALAREVLADVGPEPPVVVLTSEAGASVYSASDLAREEFPALDVSVRGAISIARRLQDPLAELVKIEPKSIGVGQYQHDVDQTLLQRRLEEVVESCVNHVGVELNTASAPLLAAVAGIGPGLGKKIVAHRERHGAFRNRQALLAVSGLGPRTFEQAAGFLRVRESEHPLDASAVHPERYDLVARMARDLGVGLGELTGNAALAEQIDIGRYVDDTVGEPTLRDIVAELQKPGRDPRAAFESPRFRADVRTLEDLEPGMVLEGVVTNVTNFGAFVDVGVKQDGLVHVSKLADRFVRDPNEVVRVGDRLTVRVLEVDLERRRISLTCRSEGAPKSPGKAPGRRPGQGEQGRERQEKRPRDKPDRFSYNPFADLLKK